MLLRVALLACALLVALTSGCGGGDDAPEDDTLAAASFKEAVLGGLRQAGLEAGPRFDLNVSAFQGPNRVDLSLEEAFAEYEADPERKDEIVAGLVEEAGRRLETGIGDVSFEEASPDLMPLLQANFDVRRYGFEPAQTEVPGNLSVVYVVDGDGGLTVVRPEDAERWGKTLPELHEVALDNLLRQTNEEEKLLCEPSGNLELCGWASGDGYDASRMVVPGLRRQIVKEYGGPAVYAVPMDDVFVALPIDLLEQGNAEERFRTKVQQDFQTTENPVSPELFVERDGELAVRR